MAGPIHLDVEAGYDRWAEVYDSEGNPLVALEESLVREWIAPRPGLRVIDVGCGTGRHALWLACLLVGLPAAGGGECDCEQTGQVAAKFRHTFSPSRGAPVGNSVAL